MYCISIEGRKEQNLVVRKWRDGLQNGNWDAGKILTLENDSVLLEQY